MCGERWHDHDRPPPLANGVVQSRLQHQPSPCPPASFTHHSFTCSTHQRSQSRGGHCNRQFTCCIPQPSESLPSSNAFSLLRPPVRLHHHDRHSLSLSGPSSRQRNSGKQGEDRYHHDALPNPQSPPSTMNAVTDASAAPPPHIITHCSHLVLYALHGRWARARAEHSLPLSGPSSQRKNRGTKSKPVGTWMSNGEGH